MISSSTPLDFPLLAVTDGEVVSVQWDQDRRRGRLLLAVALVACALALARPQAAHAGWPLASPARVALGFGASYRAADATSSSTHRGTDLAAEEGARVLAPLGGDVTFVGQVPGVGGARVRAVTIATAAGSVTLLPLASASVARGAHLSAGDAVGTLAGSGDGSSAGTHLHVGLRRGDLYVDPMGAMSPPVASTSGSGGGGGAVEPRASASGAAAVGHAGVGTHAGSHGSAREAASVSAQGVRAGDSVGEHVAGHAAVPGAQLAPGVSIGGAPVANAVVAAGGAAAARQDVVAPTASSGAVAGPSLAPLLERAMSFAERSARGTAWVLLGVLAALGALWPVWRRNPLEGLGKVPVSTGGDDVAAVSGR